MSSLVFNWYPGHMKKSVQLIHEVKKNVDLFVEILDARAIKTSHNDELVSSLKKKVISIAMKSDLAPTYLERKGIFIGSIFEKQIFAKVLNFIKNELSGKLRYYQRKGLLNPQFNLMVVGLPNVGKSAFIKMMTKGKRSICISNQPGVTKAIARYKINKHLFIYDAPGIWFKKVNDFETGAKLALINTIKHDVLPLYDLVEYAYKFWCSFDYRQMEKFFAPMSLQDNFENFLLNYCQAKKFLLKNNQLDKIRCLQHFLKLFINGKIGVVNYD